MRIAVRARYAKDPERWRKHGAFHANKWYANNKERAIAATSAWQAANPEKARAYKANNKAKRRAKDKNVASWAEVNAWKAAQKKICYWCSAKCEHDFHIDHYEPLAKGGKHEISNLVIACPSCNHRKSAKDPYTFAQSVGRLF